MRRKIVRIDEDKCNGCGLCVPSCAEGVIKIVDGKARLVAENLCDGLGACLGECPRGAISIEEREAEAFDAEAEVTQKDHEAYELPCGCPGSMAKTLKREATPEAPEAPMQSELCQWPVQLALVSPMAPYFKGADLLVAADCVPFAAPDFHRRFLRGRAVAVGCPKLDDAGAYVEKLAEIIRHNHPRSITVAHMEVPCCFGLGRIVAAALERAGVTVPVKDVTVGIDGSISGDDIQS
ncbi:MAG: ATP-binding protein [Patescibacteria group bacterium]